MSHHWLLITFTWFSPVSLQHINEGALGTVAVLDNLPNYMQYPLPYNYLNQPPIVDMYENIANAEDIQRPTRTVNNKDINTWLPNLVDTDKTEYFKNDEPGGPFIIGYHNEYNDTEVEKKNFSPWGGKRTDPKASFGHMWSWKRSANIREPKMPKRVRFSPWGGKRSGQIIYKPGAKGSKIIFSSSIPEITRIVSNYSPRGKRFNFAGFRFMPGVDSRHPIKILALTTSFDERTLREALPFDAYMESSQRDFKPGHPYNQVHLKKDGKRKMKFSIWGGKRSPPIIGPIWTPAALDVGTPFNNLLKQNKGLAKPQ